MRTNESFEGILPCSKHSHTHVILQSGLLLGLFLFFLQLITQRSMQRHGRLVKTIEIRELHVPSFIWQDLGVVIIGCGKVQILFS